MDKITNHNKNYNQLNLKRMLRTAERYMAYSALKNEFELVIEEEEEKINENSNKLLLPDS